MAQVRCGKRLVLESLELFRVQHGGERKHLERDAAAERHLLGLVDHGHAAAANLSKQPVVAERLAGLGLLSREARRRAADEVEGEQCRVELLREIRVSREE